MDHRTAFVTGASSGIGRALALELSREMGALIAGVAGALYAHYALYIESGNFNFLMSANAVLFVILGGVQTVWGAIIGAIVFTLLPEWLRFLTDWRMSAYGVILVALMALRPEGILTRGMLKRLRRLFGRRA